ncbi:MAG TPA: flagellar hook capping FlgD N-terminal domain-containing protein [Candidatus Binatia bacterium]|nr:flagellar hook capping FlgD N-terminal domain-containing protein [Candidatus Binatia bacterium]
MNTINPAQPHDTTAGTTSSSSSGLPDSQGLNNMFLKLLVAQLQNQNPLNPMDPTQFVGQLAQFSELSEVTQIDETLQQLLSSTEAGSESGSGASGSNSPAAAHKAAPNRSAVPVPSTMVSAAVSAAQAAIPNFTAPAVSILNHQIQGVF